MMLGTKNPGYLARMLAIGILVRKPVCVGQRKGDHRPGALPTHQRDDGRTVESARQIGSEGYVGLHVEPDGVLQKRSNPRRCLAFVSRHAIVEANAPPATRRHRTVLE